MKRREREILENAKHARTMSSRGLEEREIEYSGIGYILNNNSGKFSRIFEPRYAGPNATIEQIMAFYDSFAGLILFAENRAIIPNGYFWPPYEAKLIKKRKRKENLERIKEITSHPVIATLLVILVLAIIWYLFGVDLSRFN